MNRTIVELAADRLELAVVRGGRIAEVRRERWAGGEGSLAALLGRCAPVLAGWVTELGLEGSAARVVYGVRRGFAGALSCPAGVRGAAALNAARLTLADRASLPLEQNPWALREVSCDGPGEGAQRHWLACAEPDEHAQVLASWVEAAGLRLESLVPDEVVRAACAIAAAARVAGESPAVVLWLGDEASIVAGAMPGRLCFVRSIAVGLGALIDAAAGAEKGSAEARARAWEELAREGIPKPEGDARCSLLPALRPALQRLAVEIRQSIRFAMPGAGGSRVGLSVAGRGGAVPRLVEVLSAEAGCEARGGLEARGEGLASAVLEAGLGTFGLVPCGEMGRRETRRVRTGLGVGVAIALAFVAGETVLSRAGLARERALVKDLRSRLGGEHQPAAVGARLTAMRAGLVATEKQVSARFGSECDWGAALGLLSAEAREGVALDEIELVGGAPPRVRVKGSARAGTDEGAMRLLQEYVRSLGSSPIVGETSLGATVRGAEAGAAVQRFELTLDLVALPGEVVLGLAGGAGEEGR